MVDTTLEVLDFVEFLVNKTSKREEIPARQEEQEWSQFSLTKAMQGLEDEELPEYTESDLIEKWK